MLEDWSPWWFNFLFYAMQYVTQINVWFVWVDKTLRSAVLHAPQMSLSSSFPFAHSLLARSWWNIFITFLPIIFCSVSLHGALKCRSAPSKGFHMTRVCWHSECFLHPIPSYSRSLFISCSKFGNWRSLHMSNWNLNFLLTTKEHQWMSRIAGFCGQ